ncbi:hypothetical protein GWK47_043649 [Chionoecetes opilio]|uniref:RNase H type-1 domain-containing protein n=1 Tax=Chionoecetes opilio TaxID=41210 RepID=A0A8J5CJ71_CHIOP|nr:hypothetical protein GWK47_043649 [Chionoecetes opilio]
MLRPRGGPPPQSSPPRSCLRAKPMCTTRELRQHALMALAQVAERDSVYTSLGGSVDPDSGRKRCRVVTGGTEMSWRKVWATAPPSRLSWWPSSTPSNTPCHRREATVVIHTDSWGGGAGPPTAASKGQCEVQTPPSWGAYSLGEQGRRVRLKMNPSHVGVRGNEAADVAPKRAASGPNVTMHVGPPAYSSSRRGETGAALTRPQPRAGGQEEAGGLVRCSH